jgi:carbamoylphosphate synthase large subunit
LIAADTNRRELCAASSLCDLFVRTVGVDHESFREDLTTLVREEGVTAYIPIIDEEISGAATFASAMNLSVVGLNEEGAKICFDKFSTHQFLKELGIPTVETFSSDDPFDQMKNMNGQLIAKPRHGRGSLGFRLLDSPSDAARLDSDYVVQPRLSAPEFTVDAFLSGETFRAVCRERIETKAGVCTKARVFTDPALECVVQVVGEALSVRGAYCVQFMHDGHGNPLITDVNPRPGAGTAMSGACGVDFLSAHVAEALGRDPTRYLQPLGRQRYVLRVFSEIVTQ